MQFNLGARRIVRLFWGAAAPTKYLGVVVPQFWAPGAAFLKVFFCSFACFCQKLPTELHFLKVCLVFTVELEPEERKVFCQAAPRCTPLLRSLGQTFSQTSGGSWKTIQKRVVGHRFYRQSTLLGKNN